jgi:hypothetical protein
MQAMASASNNTISRLAWPKDPHACSTAWRLGPHVPVLSITSWAGPLLSSAKKERWWEGAHVPPELHARECAAHDAQCIERLSLGPGRNHPLTQTLTSSTKCSRQHPVPL